MFLIILFSIILLFIFHELYWKRRTFPPGPTPFPILGNLPAIFGSKAPGIEAFQDWSKVYGDVYTIWMGTEPTVVITSYKKLKETFVDDAESYIDKKIFRGFNETMRGGDYGVIDTNGDVWREHRRFALHTLRDFGLGKEKLQDSILLEVDRMMHDLRNNKSDIDIQALFDVSIGNVINQFLFGKRFDNEDQFHELKRLIDLFFEVQGDMATFLAYLIPWLPKKVVEWMTPTSIECRMGVFKFFESQIEEHRKEIDWDIVENRDYVETYLREQKKREKEEGDSESFNDMQLKNMCFDMWLAGMHTTTNTMGFMISYGIRFSDCQKRMQQELTEVIGDRTVIMKDKLSLPYTNAFIQETQRYCNLIPINLTHATTRSVNINGFDIPKGTSVNHQVSSVLWDPEVYPEPSEFKPTRFLDNDGNLKKSDEFLPFSVGRRVCLGEGLAKMELFLFTANLFNRFEFLPGSRGLPSMDRDFSFISKNPAYTCTVRQRYL
ncbi:unnamed protein product [Caenorhabditis angaria]|uniref:Uncharacterized protein n=1 Tax=Caenorhabditis angaria TaxID=860376 RepID=A0A9P1ISC6_9PELO|nr:unnamed protein product [Caenorhabditis angaria]